MTRFLAALALLASLGACGRSRAAAPPPEPPRLTLVAVGDILMHQDVKAAAAQSPGGFPALWADLVPLFQGADVAFGNLETPVAPATGRPGVPFQFNAPEGLPGALRASGFTVLSTANNHAFDQGPKGVAETLERLRAQQLVALGSGEDRARAEALQVVACRGFRVAFLGFTDLFNLDLNRRADQPWVRPLDLEPALAAVRDARAQADLVVVSVHWGNEYQRQPTRRQRELARALVGAGCDLVLGHHPHVLQPVEALEAGDRRGLVAYSLGNFISNQDRTYRAAEDPVAAGDSRDGAALQVRFERDAEGRAVVREALVEPLWTLNNWGQGAPRDIRVIRVGAAEAALRAEVERLSDPREGPRAQSDPAVRRRLILDRQERLRTLLLRRRRVAEVVGAPFVRSD